ncbi:MAG: FHA domain-containing protein [Planctomycetes bacterium]|nr:FHA domain-containing protein [Planctomycetota bacterium]
MKLEIIQGDQRREFVPPSDMQVITVGRGNTNDLALEEKGASRKQFTLERTAEGWKVVDQLSSNGTTLNGEKVNFAFLKEGDQIRVGQTVIKVHGIGPSKPAAAPKASPSGRTAQPISARVPVPRPAQAELHASKGAPVLALLGVVVALAMVGGVIWFVTSGKGSSSTAPENNSVAQQPKRVAELTEADRKLIGDATAIASGDATTAEKLAELDRFRQKLGERGSVVGSRVDEIRAQLNSRLERELETYVNAELASAKAKEDLGDFRAAIGVLDKLNAHLGIEGVIKAAAVAKGLRGKAEDAQTGLVQRNEEFIAGTWTEADKLVAEKKHEDAITLVEDMLRRAFFKPGDRGLHDMKLEDIRTAKRAGTQPEVVDPTIKPKILEGVKGPKPGKFPGANPLLPKGDESEKELIDALRAATIEAVNKKQLTSDKVSYQGDIATAKSADKDKLTLNGVRISKGLDGKPEEVPYTKSVAWSKLDARDMLVLFDATPKNQSTQYFAVVVFLFNNGMGDEASKRAFELYQRDNQMKDALDNLVATKRKIRIPEGGFVEYDGRFVTPEEKESGAFNRVLRDVLARFEKGLTSKDKRKREDADAAFAEMLKLGERAIEPGVKIMNEIREREVRKLEEASGMVAADDAKLRTLKDELEKRRAYALELIMDDVKYPYPYLPEPKKSEVQAEVDSRVASLREIWDDPLSFKGTATGDVDAVVEGIQILVKRMDQLDRDRKYHAVTPEEDLVYLREIVGKALSIQNYAPKGDSKAKQLLAMNAEIMRYNEDFPVGDGHADADCRAQVKVTNRYRIMFGRHALKINDKLFWAAKHHSKYQVTNNGGEIAHDIPGEPKGVDPWTRMRTEGYNAGGSENIHGGVDSTAEEAHYGWCHSSGHHRNILSSSWFVLGVGHYKVWTQVFGSEDEGDGNSESKKGL